MPAPTFSDPTTIPIGSMSIDIKSGTPTTGTGTAVGTYVAENITVNRPTNLIKRPNEIGGPNGVSMVDTYVEGTATIQIPSTGASQKIPATGNWFKLALDPSAATVYEYFAIHSPSQPFNFGEYQKMTISFIKITAPGA